MGTGKTTVGRRLADELAMQFVDTDELIESRHGPIVSIFEEEGEARFRSIEREVASELGAKTGQVIATGGRMVLDPDNREALARNGEIICLVASPEEIYRRLIDDTGRGDRPLLRVDEPRVRIDELLAERKAEYDRFPQVVTDGKSPEAIVEEIVAIWSGPGGR